MYESSASDFHMLHYLIAWSGIPLFTSSVAANLKRKGPKTPIAVVTKLYGFC